MRGEATRVPLQFADIDGREADLVELLWMRLKLKQPEGGLQGAAAMCTLMVLPFRQALQLSVVPD